MALLASAVSWLANVGTCYLASGELPKRYGNAHANLVPYQTFQARDRWITAGVGNDRQFQALCRILGLDDLPADERFATNPQRVANRDALIPRLQEAFLRQDADEWLAQLGAAGIPSGPINTVDRALSHPQVEHRGMVVEVPHPTAGSVRVVGPPFIMSETPADVRSAPPLLGEHTDRVLRERLGMADDEIARLHAEGVV